MKAILSTLFVSLIVLTGCKKEAEPLTKEKIAGTYTLTGLVSQKADGTKEDLYPSLDPCKKQESHVLDLSQVYQVNDNCQQTTQTAPWCLIGTDVLLLNRVVYDVLSYDGKNLVFIEDDDNVNGRLVRTFTRTNEVH